MPSDLKLAGLLPAEIADRYDRAIKRIEELPEDAPNMDLLADVLELMADLSDIAARALAALRPAADPKAEGLVEAFDMVVEKQWDALAPLPDSDGRFITREELQMAMDYAVLASRLAPPTPDAERAGEPDSGDVIGYVERRGPISILHPFRASPQSPATEAVRVTEAVVETACHAYWVQSHIGFVCPPWESAPWEAKRLTRDNIKAALEAALIRPPVNNSPGGEHIVADVSKAAVDTEGATKP